MKLVTHQQLEAARSELADLEDAYLRSHGWEHTCGIVPGLWIWKKGDLMSTTASGAVTIETMKFGSD